MYTVEEYYIKNMSEAFFVQQLKKSHNIGQDNVVEQAVEYDFDDHLEEVQSFATSGHQRME